MKAYVLHGVGDLRYEDVPMPEPWPGWAVVRVLAAGICSSDIPRIFEKGTYHFPPSPVMSSAAGWNRWRTRETVRGLGNGWAYSL